MNLSEFTKKTRIHVLNMTHNGKSSHIGSALSIIDMLAVLYNKIMKVDPENPEWAERDRFILSKGHAGAAVYATLSERGFFKPEILSGHYQDGSKLSGHVSHKGIPGVEFSTGSLGHGLNVGVGLALAAKLDQKKFRTFVVLSDGECDEGSNWEAILFAAHHKLDNLVCLVDYNKIQSLDTVADTIALEPFTDKWKSFNWNVLEVDGHSHEALEETLLQAVAHEGQPTVVICHTVKGKGVSFMENTVLWHYRSAQGEEYEAALKELEEK